MTEYTIVSFLEELAEDDTEKELIRLISRGLHHQRILEKILSIAKGGDRTR